MDEDVFSYQDFKCGRCGKCCKAEEVVRLTIYDIFRLSSHLSMSPNTFFKKYCIISDPFKHGYKAIYLKTRNGCPFYKDNGCSIYEFRPIVCSIFPFIYIELSHAIYRMEEITFDSCSISKVPYTWNLLGDKELLIAMEIAVEMTTEYLERYHYKFDERTAKKYFDEYPLLKSDQSLRASVLKELTNLSEDKFNGVLADHNKSASAFVYVSGFYNLYLQEIEAQKSIGKEVITLTPIMRGFLDDTIFLQFKNDSFQVIINELYKKESLDIQIKVLMVFNNEDWFSISIPSGNKILMAFCTISHKNKGILKEKFKPGELVITFKNKFNNTFLCKGKDTLGWLSNNYSIIPMILKIPS